MKPLDEASRDVIKAGRAGEAPSAADRERLRRRLGAALAAGVAGPAIAAPVATAAKWWASKAVLAGVASASLVVAVGAAVVLSRPAPPLTPVVPPPAPLVAVAPPAPTPVEAEPELEDDEPDEVAVMDDDAAPAPTKRPTRNKKSPAPVKAVEPRVEPLPPLPVAPVTSPEPDTLEAETSGLRDVYAALKGKDSTRALKLLAEQDAKFPRGQLRPEREAARVLALCASSRAEGATALTRFIDAHPGSPLISRLKGACAP